MAIDVTNFQCPSCTGPLHYVGASGRLECDYCGSSFSVEEIEKLYAGKESSAAEAYEVNQQKAEKDAQEAAAYGCDTGWGAGMRSYTCPSCGAELICDSTTVATSCPYCGNPTVVPGQYAGGKKPDCIIPFKLDKETATDALRNHYKGKPFLPRSFADNNHIEEIKGVYVPFWLYSGSADAAVQFEATRVTRRETPNETIERTDYFDVYRAGNVPFSDVPVDASTKMPNAHMDSIEPFNYGEIREFSGSYLPGFLADNYDEDAEKCSSRAYDRCKQSAVNVMRSTVNGFDSVTVRNANVNINSEPAKYAMFPVWLLATKWNEQSYLFAMNGQTGKLVGDLPTDKGKYWASFFGIFAGMALAIMAIMYAANGHIVSGTSSILITLLPSLLIAFIACAVMKGKMKSAVIKSNANDYVAMNTVSMTAQYERYSHSAERRIPKNTQQNNPPPGGRPNGR